MKVYHVYYDKVLIGVLYCERDMHKYEANQEVIQSLIQQGEPINPILLKDKKEFGEAIPYFKVRIESNHSFENLEIGFLTDKVRLKEI